MVASAKKLTCITLPTRGLVFHSLSNRMQIVVNYDDYIVVRNGQQPPIFVSWQSLFIQLLLTFATKHTDIMLLTAWINS